MTDNDKNQDGTPRPYQNADEDIEITEVHYFSPSESKRVYLGKSIRKITKEGKVSYTLLDPNDRVMGPDLPNEQMAQELWTVIAGALERRAKELEKLRKDNDKDQDKGMKR